MKELIIHTILDSLKILPFLFVTFLLLELMEHKFSKKSKEKIKKSGKLGPLLGGLLGAVPQCGFSVVATNLYATRIITLGTLIAIYLSTSDEMLPILISKGASLKVILQILLIKVIVSIIYGFIIDFILRIKNKDKEEVKIKEFCHEHNCSCEKGIFKSALKHTMAIFVFILVVNYTLNILMDLFGNNLLESILLKDSIFSPLIASLIGLIPNCGASVILTELYLNNLITISSLISGLLTGCGVGLLVLFRVNKNFKENFKILLILYLLGAFTGIVLEALMLFI